MAKLVNFKSTPSSNRDDLKKRDNVVILLDKDEMIIKVLSIKALRLLFR